MRLSKRILTSNIVQSAVCWLGAMYIRFVYFTVRWRVVRGDIPATFWDSGKPFILALWHGRLLVMPCAWRRGRPVHMLASAHRDGRLISKTVGHLGIDTIEGSSTRGGAAALKRMLRALKNGECVGISPDGPRGPRMRASSGVVAVARISGIPVIPGTFSVTRGRNLGSWDRFLVAWPFCRGVFVWGEPIEVPHDADAAMQEVYRQRIEDALNAINREADQLAGRDLVEPAVIASMAGTSGAGEMPGEMPEKMPGGMP